MKHPSWVENTWESHLHTCSHPSSETGPHKYILRLKLWQYQFSLFSLFLNRLISLYSPPSLPLGGGSRQRHHLQLPHELHQPDPDPGAELWLPSLHALLSACRHPAGFHPQPEVPGTPLSGGKPGHDRQLGPHLLLLPHGKHQVYLTSLTNLQAKESSRNLTKKIQIKNDSTEILVNTKYFITGRQKYRIFV